MKTTAKRSAGSTLLGVKPCVEVDRAAINVEPDLVSPTRRDDIFKAPRERTAVAMRKRRGGGDMFLQKVLAPRADQSKSDQRARWGGVSNLLKRLQPLVPTKK